jgi:hypothetical protein
MLRLAMVLGLAGVVGSCIPLDQVGDFALCCTCLAQKSPQGGGDGSNAVDETTNCLPDEDPADPEALAEVDLCNEQASDVITDPDNAPGIDVVDENCGIVTCQDECRGAGLRDADFNLVEEGLGA